MQLQRLAERRHAPREQAAQVLDRIWGSGRLRGSPGWHWQQQPCSLHLEVIEQRFASALPYALSALYHMLKPPTTIPQKHMSGSGEERRSRTRGANQLQCIPGIGHLDIVGRKGFDVARRLEDGARRDAGPEAQRGEQSKIGPGPGRGRELGSRV